MRRIYFYIEKPNKNECKFYINLIFFIKLILYNLLEKNKHLFVDEIIIILLYK